MRAPLRFVAAFLAYLIAAHGLMGATAGAHRLATAPDLSGLCHGDPQAPAKDHDCRLPCVGALAGTGDAPRLAVDHPAPVAFDLPSPRPAPANAPPSRQARAHPPTGPPLTS